MLKPNGGANDRVELELVIDNLPSAILVLDKDRRVLLGNRTAETFVQKTREEFYGLRGGEAFGCIHSSVHPKGCGYAPACEHCTVKKAVLDTFTTRENNVLAEAEMVFSETGKRLFKVSTTFLTLKENDVVILAMEDITELKKQERVLIENERLRAAMETGGAVCHEMNQPLMALSGYVDLMMLDHQEENKNYKMLKTMRQSVDRLGDITRKLMNLTRYQTKSYLKGRIVDLEQASRTAGPDAEYRDVGVSNPPAQNLQQA